ELGKQPTLVEARNRPFRTVLKFKGATIDVRMESWLPTDTIRRAGFGHVIVDRRHVLTLERGLSLVALDARGEAVLAAYRNGIFAPVQGVRLAGSIGR